MRPALMIFDLDGTLIDSAADLAHAVNAMLGEFGCAPLAEREVRAMIGEGMAKLVARALAARPCAHVDRTAAEGSFLRHYASEPMRATDYEALLRRHAPEYERVQSLRAQQQGIGEFFGGAPQQAVFANRQILDLEGLQGRLMSSSYAPEPGEPQHAALIAGLRQVFERHQQGGSVVFPYRTLVFFGQP